MYLVTFQHRMCRRWFKQSLLNIRHHGFYCILCFSLTWQIRCTFTEWWILCLCNYFSLIFSKHPNRVASKWVSENEKFSRDTKSTRLAEFTLFCPVDFFLTDGSSSHVKHHKCILIQIQTTAAQVRLEIRRFFFCKVILRSMCNYFKFEGLQTVRTESTCSSENHVNL